MLPLKKYIEFRVHYLIMDNRLSFYNHVVIKNYIEFHVYGCVYVLPYLLSWTYVVSLSNFGQYVPTYAKAVGAWFLKFQLLEFFFFKKCVNTFETPCSLKKVGILIKSCYPRWLFAVSYSFTIMFGLNPRWLLDYFFH